MAPKISDSLKEGIDIVHHIGQRRQDGYNRSGIVFFALRRLRDAIWREAKGSKFLLDIKLRITEALSPENKAAREKLWPLVKKAREDGIKASFCGPFAFINGKKIRLLRGNLSKLLIMLICRPTNILPIVGYILIFCTVENIGCLAIHRDIPHHI